MRHTTAFYIGLLVVPACAIFEANTSEELLASYPALESNRTGNPRIICPYLRMIERSGRLDEFMANESVVDNGELKDATEDFGCDTVTACGPIVDVVSLGQNDVEGVGLWLSVLNPFDDLQLDLERLWDAPPVSHECGFTFLNGEGDQGVSSERLESTMERFASRAATTNGTLSHQDIMDVKMEICAEEGVEMSSAGETEANLIFAYLGGIERGYVMLTDVERFLQVDSEMPATKAEKQITAFYLLQIDD